MKAVIDTNVWLDWLVFNDESVRALKESTIEIVACNAMRAELADVLARPQFALGIETQSDTLQAYDTRITRLEPPDVSMTRLRCTDRDDQKFIELAVAAGCQLLLTQDKALLKLARRAHKEHGLAIQRAVDWSDTSR